MGQNSLPLGALGFISKSRVCSWAGPWHVSQERVKWYPSLFLLGSSTWQSEQMPDPANVISFDISLSIADFF